MHTLCMLAAFKAVLGYNKALAVSPGLAAGLCSHYNSYLLLDLTDLHTIAAHVAREIDAGKQENAMYPCSDRPAYWRG